MKIKLLAICILILNFGCKKDKQTTIEGVWNLKNYAVSYYDQVGNKVFENKPNELLQFSKVEISGDSINIFSVTKTSSQRNPITTHPANVTYLNVQQSLNKVLVRFGTVSELNVSYWDISRSGEQSSDFTSIGTIKAFGNSSISRDYIYEDKYPLFGFNYYKVTYFDFDGRSTNIGVKLLSVKSVLSKVNENTYLPVNLVNNTFKKVAITFTNNTMLWQDEALNVQYLENGILKNAAKAKLSLEFTK